MKIVTFEEGQRSEDWLAWRRNGIGASDIPILMGTSDYSTPRGLWKKKIGEAEETYINAAMRHGIQNEDRARNWLNENMGLHLTPLCIEDNEKPEFKASLDGYDFDSRTLAEIKCPVNETLLDAVRLKQFVPASYYDQMQWQIRLCKPIKAFLGVWDYRYEMCYTIEIYGCEKRIKEIEEAAADFWHHVRLGKPPAFSQGDYKDLEDPKLSELLFEYKDLGDKINALKERQKELKDQIVPYGEGQSFKCANFMVREMSPRTSYDYKKMELDGIELEKYAKASRGEPSFSIISPRSEKCQTV